MVRRNDPAARVREADAVEASLRCPRLALRGPVFGIAARDPGEGRPWRLVLPVSDGMTQMARDGLNSCL